jgi:hypothetical protein
MGLHQGAIFCGHSLKVIATFCLNMSRYSIQIYLQYLVRYPVMNLHLSSVWELHASPPLKILIRISGRDSFKGEGCDTPGVYFALCRKIYPNLECSVKISISRSHLSPFIKLLVKVSPISEFIRSQEQPTLEPVKTFISWNEYKFESQSRLATPVHTHLFGLSIVVMLSDLCPESAFSIVGLRPNT